jgi:hypothetical protein
MPHMCIYSLRWSLDAHGKVLNFFKIFQKSIGTFVGICRKKVMFFSQLQSTTTISYTHTRMHAHMQCLYIPLHEVVEAPREGSLIPFWRNEAFHRKRYNPLYTFYLQHYYCMWVCVIYIPLKISGVSPLRVEKSAIFVFFAFLRK